jgi:arabinose-5-phosphate isomerase
MVNATLQAAAAMYRGRGKPAKPRRQEGSRKVAVRLKSTTRITTDAVASALRTVATERAGLTALETALRDGLARPFAAAVEVIHAATGKVVVSGVGKSGHIGRKVAATLASTGTPAFFVHPTEAGHGDLGMIAEGDVVLALSWSGETVELRTLVEYAGRFRIPLVAITAAAESALAVGADVALVLPRAEEACPHGLAPTTSTLMQLAVGDGLAIALLERRGFTAEKFRVLHPGGKLGASLHFVRDIMHRDREVPLVKPAATTGEAIRVISDKGFGCVGVVDGAGLLVGIVTDGDLRRHMAADLLARPVTDVMTRSPKTVPPDCLVGEALAMMNMHTRPFTVLFVVEDGKPVGIVHMHDFLRIGVA